MNRKHATTVRNEYIRRHGYICAKCGGDGWWRGKFLTYHINHIDGNDRNNADENLELLCPNCHQQDPHTGVNKKKREHVSSITPEIMNSMITRYKEVGSIRETLFRMGFSQRDTRVSDMISIEVSKRGLPKKDGKYSISTVWSDCSDEGKRCWSRWYSQGITRNPPQRMIDDIWMKFEKEL